MLPAKPALFIVLAGGSAVTSYGCYRIFSSFVGKEQSGGRGAIADEGTGPEVKSTETSDSGSQVIDEQNLNPNSVVERTTEVVDGTGDSQTQITDGGETPNESGTANKVEGTPETEQGDQGQNPSVSQPGEGHQSDIQNAENLRGGTTTGANGTDSQTNVGG